VPRLKPRHVIIVGPFSFASDIALMTACAIVS
jgi:hypothetical protein